MLPIIGIIVVFGAIIGGYLMEHGNLSVLVQPAELLIIGGASIGALLIASPVKVLNLIKKNFFSIFTGTPPTKTAYIELLALLNLILSKIRKDGLISIEADIENPKKSAIFQKYKTVLANEHALEFICDNLKVIITANMPPHELDSLMDIDIEAHHSEETLASQSVATTADSLPGLGIVAAVLGVVLTMAKIDAPPKIIGESVGAALVGTFLGVLLCYGIVCPMSVNLGHAAREKEVYLQVIKVVLVAFVGGAAPQMAVESGRRAIPTSDRPSFSELEKSIRK